MYENFGLISVIMAAYNSEKTIKMAIESVLKQTYTNFELLVINDCSTDNTEKIVCEIIRRDSRVRLLRNEKRGGVSVARKRGLAEVKGEWIAILDSDDAWAEEKLEKQIVLQRKTNAELLFTGSAFMDSEGLPIHWYLHVPTEVTYKQLLKQNKVVLNYQLSLIYKNHMVKMVILKQQYLLKKEKIMILYLAKLMNLLIMVTMD